LGEYIEARVWRCTRCDFLCMDVAQMDDVLDEYNERVIEWQAK